MKKILAFLCASILIIFSMIFFNTYLEKDVHKKYDDRMGEIIDSYKYEGIAMQHEAAVRNGTLFLYGSSEVGEVVSKDPYHPSNFFTNKKDGFQVELVGRAYRQSLINAINIGALGDELRNNKVVFLISPQWFDTTGLTRDHLNINFSEEQLYAYMYNSKIDSSLKKQVAQRVYKLTKGMGSKSEVHNLCYLIADDTPVNKLRLLLETPYYKARYFMLRVRDYLQSENIMNNCNVIFKQNEKSHKTNINWAKEYAEFKNLPINNPYGFDYYAYAQDYKNKINLFKKRTAIACFHIG